jgi:hypothetical protein
MKILMRFGIFLLLLLLLMVISPAILAQDTLIYINGKKEVAKNVRLADTQIHYSPAQKPQHLKKVETYNIFAIRYGNGSETVMYSQDTLTDDFSIEQMRMFVKGQQDAIQYYNPTAVSVSSAIIGVGSGLFLQFFALAPPAVFATIVGASSPKMERQPVDRDLLNSEEYRMGYETKARNIKIKRALIYGIGGALVGYAGFRVIEANQD